MTLLHLTKYRANAFIFGTLLFLHVIAPAWPVPAAAAQDLPEDLTELSLEELINIEVVSAAKKSQPLSETDAAVFVITQEDIARSGATSIPEALRMVPGLQVARIDANKWAISARGFNSRFANKLLVLVDGRSVYSPLFSGVFWDTVDTLMEDIDRIEVIRGPGATIWGGNAVNGVINIITKNASETLGILTAGSAGTEENSGAVRYGAELWPETSYRIYAKYFDKESGVLASGETGPDAMKSLRAGFRFDKSDLLTLEGEIYSEDARTEMDTPALGLPDTDASSINDDQMTGGHLLGQWNYHLSEQHEFSCQIYYDRAETDLTSVNAAIDTFDGELTHLYSPGPLGNITWGLEYRFVKDSIIPKTSLLSIEAETSHYDLLNGFVQGALYLMDNRLRLTAGTKLEHNDFTGFEIQPSIRFLWAPQGTYSVWGAVSRAVRTPLRAEVELTFNPDAFQTETNPPTTTAPPNSPETDPESLLAFELGYRRQFGNQLSMDIASFYNFYRNLRFGRIATPGNGFSEPPPIGSTPFTLDNGRKAETFGLETAFTFIVSDAWSLSVAYSYLHLQIERTESEVATSEQSVEGSSPQHQVSLRTQGTLTESTTLDLWLRYVDSLDFQKVDSYVTGDIRLAWQATDRMEISITGQNLLAPSHQEFVPQFVATIATETERSVYGKMTWRF